MCGSSIKRKNNGARGRRCRYSASPFVQLSAALATQPHHNVDAGDLVAFRRDRRLFDDHSGVRNIEQGILALDKEMMMLSVVGVEISLRAIDGDLAQQPDVGELMQGV